MNKILRYSLMLLVAMLSTVSYAEEATFDWSTNSTTQTGLKTDNVFTQDKITLTFSKGTNSYGNIPALNKDGSLRMYINTALNIKAEDGYIVTKVVFTPTGKNYNATNLQYNGAALTSDEWTVPTPAQSIDLTASANARFKKIVVTYQSSTGNIKKDADLRWSESSVSLKKGDGFTAPTFSKATTANVTFQSDNEAVASVNSEGVISLGTEAGTAIITATSAENDTYSAGTATCTIEVYNVNIYKKVTSIESGKKYIIAAQRGGDTYYAYPLNSSADRPTPYGYLQSGKVEGMPDELEINQKYDDSFVLTAVGNAYSIKDSKNGLYYVQSGTYNSFNTSTTSSEEWTIEAQSDGTFKITMNDYYIQFGQGTYTTFGMWTEAQDNAVMPCLYVYEDASTSINGVKTVENGKDAPVYNLAGQRVSKDYKGVVIQNGKKRINK